mmetsp:Transcript_13325/g.36751  ORF Transcript_13325/g.36751 Transcript_13325/m.36751 type:complete len:241 (+) Transcript_13325:233-955(+)
MTTTTGPDGRCPRLRLPCFKLGMAAASQGFDTNNDTTIGIDITTTTTTIGIGTIATTATIEIDTTVAMIVVAGEDTTMGTITDPTVTTIFDISTNTTTATTATTTVAFNHPSNPAATTTTTTIVETVGSFTVWRGRHHNHHHHHHPPRSICSLVCETRRPNVWREGPISSKEKRMRIVRCGSWDPLRIGYERHHRRARTFFKYPHRHLPAQRRARRRTTTTRSKSRRTIPTGNWPTNTRT